MECNFLRMLTTVMLPLPLPDNIYGLFGTSYYGNVACASVFMSTVGRKRTYFEKLEAILIPMATASSHIL